MRALKRSLGIGLFLALSLPAADLAGIWMGETTGRNGEKQDVAFQFQSAKGVLTGVMFGDEFDLPVQDLRIDGIHVSFAVVNINYFDGRRTKTVYTGIVGDTTLELTREQANPDAAANAARAKDLKQTITLKRLT